jgi:DMSO/TMAO reductase YedYZ molybdopterin-dependent catalytic subunit
MVSGTNLDGGSSTLVTRQENPLVKEATLPSLDSWITPTPRFYVRNHFSESPALSLSSWRLEVDGQVGQPLTLNFDDILSFPSKEMVMTMECAGNSRSDVTPPAEGLPFGNGAVSTARFKGVALNALLEKTGIGESTVAVIFEGADRGEEEEDGIAFELAYRRSLPLATARHDDILLAYEMNGEPLTKDHGFPLRLVVPSWYGMASVKWLTRINLTAEPFDGFFQQRRYVMINEGREDTLDREPITRFKVKSVISSPRHGEVIQGPVFNIRGFAWTGVGQVTRVEISTDGGRNWRDATLLGDPVPNVWREWELPWEGTRPGHYILKARATDSAGDIQPQSIPWNFRGYANNSIQTIAVEVPAGRPIPS